MFLEFVNGTLRLWEAAGVELRQNLAISAKAPNAYCTVYVDKALHVRDSVGRAGHVIGND